MTVEVMDEANASEQTASDIPSQDSELRAELMKWQSEVQAALSAERAARESAMTEVQHMLKKMETQLGHANAQDRGLRSCDGGSPEGGQACTATSSSAATAAINGHGVSEHDSMEGLRRDLESLRQQHSNDVCSLAELLAAEQKLVLARISIMEVEVSDLRKETARPGVASSTPDLLLTSRLEEAITQSSECSKNLADLHRHIEDLEGSTIKYQAEMQDKMMALAGAVASKERVEAFRIDMEERFDELSHLRDQVEQLACMEPSAGRPPHGPVTLAGGLRRPSTGGHSPRFPTSPLAAGADGARRAAGSSSAPIAARTRQYSLPVSTDLNQPLARDVAHPERKSESCNQT